MHKEHLRKTTPQTYLVVTFLGPGTALSSEGTPSRHTRTYLAQAELGVGPFEWFCQNITWNRMIFEIIWSYCVKGRNRKKINGKGNSNLFNLVRYNLIYFFMQKYVQNPPRTIISPNASLICGGGDEGCCKLTNVGKIEQKQWHSYDCVEYRCNFTPFRARNYVAVSCVGEWEDKIQSFG